MFEKFLVIYQILLDPPKSTPLASLGETPDALYVRAACRRQTLRERRLACRRRYRPWRLPFSQRERLAPSLRDTT
jgi:hypothetical protein